MPTPCCVAPLGGIAVPGTPSLMVRNRSASELPCFFCARVRSGPRPPPRAPSPWQKAQLARNSNSPSFAALGSFASGFLSCPHAGPVPTTPPITKSSAACMATPPLNHRRKFETHTPMLPPAPCTAAHRKFARTIPPRRVNRPANSQMEVRKKFAGSLHCTADHPSELCSACADVAQALRYGHLKYETRKRIYAAEKPRV